MALRFALPLLAIVLILGLTGPAPGLRQVVHQVHHAHDGVHQLGHSVAAHPLCH